MENGTYGVRSGNIADNEIILTGLEHEGILGAGNPAIVKAGAVQIPDGKDQVLAFPGGKLPGLAVGYQVSDCLGELSRGRLAVDLDHLLARQAAGIGDPDGQCGGVFIAVRMLTDGIILMHLVKRYIVLNQVTRNSFLAVVRLSLM